MSGMEQDQWHRLPMHEGTRLATYRLCSISDYVLYKNIDTFIFQTRNELKLGPQTKRRQCAIYCLIYIEAASSFEYCVTLYVNEILILLWPDNTIHLFWNIFTTKFHW